MKDYVAEYKISKDKLLRIVQDDSPESPREWDNLGTMVCFHRSYDLGDKHDFNTPDDFHEWYQKNKKMIAVILPLYLYDHSGITMSYNCTYPYNDRWDAGQVGYIYVTKENVRKEYSVKAISKKMLERVTKYLEGEVKTYDMYLRGDVYGFQIITKSKCDHGCEHEDTEKSYYGYYGNDLKENGILDNLSREERKVVEAQL